MSLRPRSVAEEVRTMTATLEALVCRDSGRELMRLALQAFHDGDRDTGAALRNLSRREYATALRLLLDLNEQEVAV